MSYDKRYHMSYITIKNKAYMDEYNKTIRSLNTLDNDIFNKNETLINLTINKKKHSQHKKCTHRKSKYHCNICNISYYCIHKAVKKNCTICTPTLLCVHDMRFASCLQCNKNLTCEHNKRKSVCII